MQILVGGPYLKLEYQGTAFIVFAVFCVQFNTSRIQIDAVVLFTVCKNADMAFGICDLNEEYCTSASSFAWSDMGPSLCEHANIPVSISYY